MAMSNLEPIVAPDREQMQRHVAHLFELPLEGCDGGCIELAWTDSEDRKLRHAAIFRLDRLDELVERAIAENRRPGQNVYIGQALRKPDTPPSGRCKDEDFFALTAFYVDVDDDVMAAAATEYSDRRCPPTGVIVTGRHPHVRAQMVWRLEHPVHDPAACRHQNIALAEALRGDPTVVNPSRVLRLGGSVAWPLKSGRVIERTEFVSFDDGRPKVYVAEQVAKAFPPRVPLFQQTVRAALHPPSANATHTYSTESSGPTTAAEGPVPATRVPLQVGSSMLSVEACLAAIRAGNRWHDNLVRVTGHWVSRGWSDEEILTTAEALTLPGYTVEQTRRELAVMVEGGRRKWSIANSLHRIDSVGSGSPLQPAFLDSLNLAALPRRRWLLGRSLLRGQLTLLVAPPGVGKSTHGIARAVAVATSQEITGEAVHEPVKAWIYNTEDDADELKRRLGAVLQHWSIPFSKLRGRIALNSGADRPLLFARTDHSDTVIRLPDVDACIVHIREHDIGLFVVDPFVETHEVNENSNEQIKAVAIMFREVARSTNCAVLLVHHTAKPPQGGSDGHAGNMNTARGASALVGVARVVQTLFAMSEKDAEQYGVPTQERHLHLRLDDAKANLSLISSDASWYRKVSVELPNGDEAGVLVPHEFEKPSFSTHTAVEILKLIDERWKEKNPFSGSPQSDRYVVPVIVQRFSLTKKTATSLLKSWIGNEMVRAEEVDSHSKARGLRVMRWPG
jgi:hypothetical protein